MSSQKQSTQEPNSEKDTPLQKAPEGSSKAQQQEMKKSKGEQGAQSSKQAIKGAQSGSEGNEEVFSRRVYYNEKEYFKTKSRNLISKRCLIKSSDNIEIYDHAIIQPKIILRADLAKIFIGRYVILSEGVIVKPPSKRQNNQIRHVPVEVGSHVFVDRGSILQAAKVGSYVKIGRDCIIGPRVLIGDCCTILDGTVVPADAQLIGNSVYGGKPAVYMGELPESASIVQKHVCVSYFDNFVETKNPELLAKTDPKKQLKKESSSITVSASTISKPDSSK